MTELADKLATLTGLDREVDTLVHQLFRPEYAPLRTNGAGWFIEADGRTLAGQAPLWTSNISAVVSEVERRGLGWRLESGLGGGYFATIFAGGIAKRQRDVMGPTACLALLRALVAAVESADAG